MNRMADTHTAESPLEAAAGAAGPHATDAFELLANETRLAILLALWEAYDPRANHNTMSFSDLLDRVGYDSPGNFSYHLEQLEGQFVQRSPDDEGYELRTTGLKLVRAVIAGAGVHETDRGPTELDDECPLCGSRIAITYRDGVMYLLCTECEGRHPDRHALDGVVSAMKFDPAGVTDRTPKELLAAVFVAQHRHIRTMFEGLCSACSGPVDATLDVCSNHDSDGVCQECGREFRSWVHFQCRVCKDHHGTAPASIPLFHPAVIAFYHDHDVSTQLHADDVERVQDVIELLMKNHDMEVVSEDPPRVEVTVSYGGDHLYLSIDETVTVVDVSQ